MNEDDPQTSVPFDVMALPLVDCPHGGGASCPTCVAMCEDRPCWPTPDEARALIAAGFADRLWHDYWAGGGYAGGHIHLLGPAAVGYEGRHAGFLPLGRCTFLTDDGYCALKRLGLQPREGALADCTQSQDDIPIHRLVAETWNTPDGQALVDEWHVARHQSHAS